MSQARYGLVILFVLAFVSPASAAKKWLCNYAGCMHEQPSDCSDPAQGGKWVDDGTGDADDAKKIQDSFWAQDEETRGKVLGFAAADALKRLAAAGYTYGNRIDDKELNCTTFTELMLRSVGARVTDEISKAINVPIAKSKLQEAVADEDEAIKGVQKALVDAGMGEAVEPTDVKVGDPIQIWDKQDGKWRGHSGIISSVRKDSKGDIRAKVTSPSATQSGKNGGKVTDDKGEWNMSNGDTDSRKYYPVRLMNRS